MRLLLFLFAVGVGALPACREPPAATPDATRADAGVDAPLGKDAYCAASFGNALTNAHGRVDGIITAVVEPGNMRCAQPNNDHVIVQVRMNNAIYRMVVNIESNGTVKEIRMRTLPHALVGPAYSEGWHPGINFDYVTDLGVHTTDEGWTAEPLQAASKRIADAMTIGAPIAVYATSSGGTFASGAHLVHRNLPGLDGALVIDPTGTNPQFMLFHFENQSF